MDWIDVNIQECVNMCVANVAACVLIGKIDDPESLLGFGWNDPFLGTITE